MHALRNILVLKSIVLGTVVATSHTTTDVIQNPRKARCAHTKRETRRQKETMHSNLNEHCCDAHVRRHTHTQTVHFTPTANGIFVFRICLMKSHKQQENN